MKSLAIRLSNTIGVLILISCSGGGGGSGNGSGTDPVPGSEPVPIIEQTKSEPVIEEHESELTSEPVSAPTQSSPTEPTCLEIEIESSPLDCTIIEEEPINGGYCNE